MYVLYYIIVLFMSLCYCFYFLSPSQSVKTPQPMIRLPKINQNQVGDRRIPLVIPFSPPSPLHVLAIAPCPSGRPGPYLRHGNLPLPPPPNIAVICHRSVSSDPPPALCKAHGSSPAPQAVSNCGDATSIRHWIIPR